MYGQCRSDKKVKKAGDFEKYRKPPPPQLPEYCYIEVIRDGEKEKVLDDLQYTKPECNPGKPEPNVFDATQQSCSASIPGSCLDRDMNFVCGANSLCQCRKDMMWNEL